MLNHEKTNTNYQFAPDKNTNSNYVVVKLIGNPNLFPQSDAEAIDMYLNDAEGNLYDNIFFKAMIDIGKNGNNKELVPGYAEIENYGKLLTSTSGDKYFMFKVKLEDCPDKLNGNDMHPFNLAALNFGKLYLPRIINNMADPNASGIIQILESLVGAFKAVGAAFGGYYDTKRQSGYGTRIDLTQSMVRLNNGVGIKKGGGSRVSKITMNDNWKSMGGVGNTFYEDAKYGQTYKYRLTKKINGREVEYSSGVAQYEPLVGGDENPWRNRISYSETAKMAPSRDYYIETPLGESFFPSAGVGYSRVEVQDISNTGHEIHGTGKTVKEFYTAKDFPVRLIQTPILARRDKSNAVADILNFFSFEFQAASQGYSIILNDMHGKNKSEQIYQVGATSPYKRTDYYYKTDEKGNLNNSVKVLNKNGVIEEKTVGVDHDFIVDMREQYTKSINTGAGGNLETFLIAVFPGLVPMILPKYAEEETRFRGVSTTKVINQYAMQEKVVTQTNGNSISRVNKLYDATTGEVLLTETVNEYNPDVNGTPQSYDRDYAFNYPGHLGYENFAQAYHNEGIVGEFSAVTPYFSVGDVLGISGARYWVKTTSPLVIINENGQHVSIASNAETFILSSGRKNLHNISIGRVTTMHNPIVPNGSNFSLDFVNNEILNADATEYSDKRMIYCECGNYNSGYRHNEFLKGLSGSFKPFRSYYYLTDRQRSDFSNNTNMKTDGKFVTFNPFWTPNSGQDWTMNTTNWDYSSVLTVVDPFGSVLEEQNAIGIHSSELWGYNYSKVTGTANNAKYSDIAFDSFEDYDFNDCADDHFSYELGYKSSVADGISHSGRRSIKVGPNTVYSLKKYVDKCN